MSPDEGRGESARSGTSEAYLEAVTLGGPERLEGTIYLAPYDPKWPERFAELAGRICRALGPKVLLLEHVGSTSVPGLPAKPVIDMILAVADSADEASYVPSLEAAGFVLRIREPDRYQHRLLKTVEGDANLHVFSRGCEEIDRRLAFRDWLRTHEDDRRLYEETKKRLAARTWTYTQHYADAKSEPVQQILERALATTPIHGTRRGQGGDAAMTVTPIRLVPADAERYTRLRLRMLTQAPWAFARTPEDDPGLDAASVAAHLAGPEYAIFAVEEAQVSLSQERPASSSPSDLVAAAGILRMKGPKFAHRSRLWGVFVEPAYRGRGLGRLVVQAAVDLARSWTGVAYVDLGVSENSPEALRLYGSLGFQAWGREPETTQYGDRRFDEIFMTLKL